jgi:uncharacterized protein
MAKPTGAKCNLDCEYCFYLSKEMLYPGSRFEMAAESQETYIRQLLEAHAHAPEAVVAWQGGEPTMMGLEFFRRSNDLQRQYARPGQQIMNTIQTNGTLRDELPGPPPPPSAARRKPLGDLRRISDIVPAPNKALRDSPRIG